MKAKSQRLLKVGIAVFVVFWLMSNCAFAEEDNSGKKLTDELEHIELEETKENYDAGTRLSRVDNVVVFLRFSDVDEYVNPALIGQADQMYHSGKDALKKYVERISYHKVTTSAAFFPKENDGSTYSSVQISKPLTFLNVSIGMSRVI